MNNELISIIITTKNEEKNIENCLKSISLQTYKNIEIIVVDNGSTDRTKEIAKQYTDLLYDKGPERSAQRNYGVNVSKGRYILYIDADMILSSELVFCCIKEIEKNKDTAGLYIPEIVLGKSFWCGVRRFERNFYDGTVIDAVRFIKKSSFTEVNGFDETMSGPEDWDFNRKLSRIGELKVLADCGMCRNDSTYEYTKADLKKRRNNFRSFLAERGIKSSHKYLSVLFHNESDFNLGKYLNKKDYYTKGFSIYINKWGKNDAVIRKQFGITYRYLVVFIENGKWKKLIMHPVLTSGMYALRFIVGILYLRNKR